jgi:hypothetical protein
MSPQPSPPGTPFEGRRWVWAVDEIRLSNYLLPRDCPRVCWATPNEPVPLLTSPAQRVIAIEDGWSGRLLDAGVRVHELEPSQFTLLDPVAGYWVSECEAAVRDVWPLDDCFTAIAERHVELRLTPSLWPYLDAAVAHGTDFSAIRMRNARLRADAP